MRAQPRRRMIVTDVQTSVVGSGGAVVATVGGVDREAVVEPAVDRSRGRMILMISMTRRNVRAKSELNDEVGILTPLNATYIISRNVKTIFN
jgi:hypothetical protein